MNRPVAGLRHVAARFCAPAEARRRGWNYLLLKTVTGSHS